ncbi:hypothetical protein DVA76_18690, partial [Acinetobacter baumannii]
KANKGDIRTIFTGNCLCNQDKLRQLLWFVQLLLATFVSTSAMTHVKDTFQKIKETKEEVILFCFDYIELLIRPSALRV